MNPDGSYGQPKQDLTLQDPHCVFQLIKKQFSYYTPEVVADICGCRPADIVKVGELIGRNSGRDRTTLLLCDRLHAAFQRFPDHSNRRRLAAIARQHRSPWRRHLSAPRTFQRARRYRCSHAVQCLAELHSPTRSASCNATLADYLANGHGFSGALDKTSDGMWKLETERGSWASLPNYMVSLLKAYYAKTPPKTTNMAINGSRSSVTTNRSPSPWKKPFVAVWMAWW